MINEMVDRYKPMTLIKNITNQFVVVGENVGSYIFLFDSN